ncbi:plasmid stabilization protein [[Bacillus thuringiensis] serovar konkukian]|nr:plasmid stabilization protein [Bacillus thuringiensis]MED1305608.1 plasmid stabilization protein [Bacillus pacificus]OUA94866.1 plasmid stabilization protein [[Bacillus thuringiensis] serovar konkukian]
MPQKITLTGMPKTEVRDCNTYFAFEMTEKGGPTAPKGIPFKSTAITYTVFVSKKQFKKLEIDSQGFQNTKLLVQGEPTLDAPIDVCPGEVGVICMQIGALPQKAEKPKEDKAKEKKQEYVPEGTEAVIPLDKIVLIERYQVSVPRQEKQDIVMQAIQKNGTIDKPILIDKETKILKDGFSRYFVARKMKLQTIPVCYE